MYNRLLSLPLFTGMTAGELTQMLAHIHMEFQQFESGEVIVAQDDRCNKLIYVLKGKVRTEYIDHERHFVLQEYIDYPFVIEPYNMHGMMQKYEHTYMTEERTDTVMISKQEFHAIMLNYKIPRMNIMNLLCAKVQKAERLLREGEPKTVEEKIVQFIRRYAITGKGTKLLQIKMEDLANHIQETRINVSNVLKAWNQQGLIKQGRGTIIVEEVGKLKIENSLKIEK